MRRERKWEKKMRKEKVSLYFVQFWEMRKKKRLERANGQKCYSWQNEKRKKDRENKKKSEK